MVNYQSIQSSQMDEYIMSWAAVTAAETNTSIIEVLFALKSSINEVYNSL